MRELFFPRTDDGVLLQLVLVMFVVSTVVVLVRRERSLMTLTVGVGLVVVGLMGLRAVH
jgi:hypothetical protein